MLRVPIRTCAGCGAKVAPHEMLRIASYQGAPPQLVTDRRAHGRSAYLCFSQKCADKAFARRALERSLRLKNSAPPQIKEQILRAANSSADC